MWKILTGMRNSPTISPRLKHLLNLILDLACSGLNWTDCKKAGYRYFKTKWNFKLIPQGSPEVLNPVCMDYLDYLGEEQATSQKSSCLSNPLIYFYEINSSQACTKKSFWWKKSLHESRLCLTEEDFHPLLSKLGSL